MLGRPGYRILRDGIEAGIGRPGISMGCGCDMVEVISLSMGESIYVSSSK